MRHSPLLSSCCLALQPNQEGQAPYSWFLAVAISTGVGEGSCLLPLGKRVLVVVYKQRGIHG